MPVAPRPLVPAAASSAEDVIVRAPPGPTLGRDPTVAGSVIPRERLEAPGLRASDVLRSQPGVQVTDSGGFGAPATASVRGATSAQTPVYLGGIRLNDDVAGIADLSLVPLWLVRRIEVYRGNAPMDADRLGIGGAIFFEPRRPVRPEMAAGAMLGSFGARSGWTYGAVGDGNTSVLAGVSFERATNNYPYVNDRGTLFDRSGDTTLRRQNADAQTLDAWVLGRLRLGAQGHGALTVNHLDREQGVPRLALVPSRAARAHLTRTLVGLDVTVPNGDRCLWSSHTAFLNGSSRYDDPLYELALFSPRTTVMGHRVEQSVGVRVALSDTVAIRTLVNGAVETLLRHEGSREALRARRVFSRGALAGEWRVAPPVTVHALGTSECHGTSPAGRASLCDIIAPAGRVGAVLRGPDRSAWKMKNSPIDWSFFSFFVNAGRYARIPTLGELYGISEVVRGNARLHPESGWTIDGGVRAESSRGGRLRGTYLDAFVFRRTVRDLVAYARSGQGVVVPINVDGARVQGIEALLGTGLGSFALAEVAATVNDPRDTSPGRTLGNNVLPYRSRLLITPRLRFESRSLPISWAPRGGVEVRYTYQSSRYADPAGLGVIAAQGTFDLEADAHGLGDQLHLRLRVANLFDQTRTDLIGYPLPGRSAFFSMEITL